MITGKQIRAARVLLDWDAEDLAAKAGVNRETVFNIERGTVQPRPGTIEKLIKAFNEHRVEFLDDQGVRFRHEDVEVLNGEAGMETFWNRVYVFAQSKGGIIRQNGIAEDPLDKCAPKAAAQHRDRMAPLVEKNKNIFVRAILDAGDENFLCTNYADYKWAPKDFPPPVPYYIFGDCVALFSFDAVPSPKVILITSAVIARTYIKQFDRCWECAGVPSVLPIHRGSKK